MTELANRTTEKPLFSGLSVVPPSPEVMIEQINRTTRLELKQREISLDQSTLTNPVSEKGNSNQAALNPAATSVHRSKSKVGRRAHLERAMQAAFVSCGLLTIVVVFAIAVYLIVSGLPAIREIGLREFLFGTVWRSTGADAQFGILPFILTSVFSTLGALAIGVPIGLMTSVFLAKLAPTKLANTVNTAVELLAGIPSVVYGFVGMIVLVPAVMRLFDLQSGATLLSAIIVLSVMILPILTNVSRVALQAVPREYEDASLALGATWIETIFKISIPAAKSGIAAGVVLGIGRAIGEAMAVILVIGNIANMPSLLSPARTLTTAIAQELSYAAGLQRDALFSIGLVLFVFIFFINLTLNLVLKRGGSK